MATYKAEFLAHYYEGRLRPVTAYSIGLIHWWARLAARAPWLANFFTQTAGLRRVVQAAGGIAQERRMPAFAPQTFQAWFRKRERRNQGRPPVILWADTFNNHFHPATTQAAVEVLEDAGFRVIVPRAALCCGRPLYDFGMLDAAKRLLAGCLDALHPALVRGVPVVGLEPSCVAVFRDEMVNLLPNDEDAKRLHDQVFMLSEFLVRKAPHYQPPRLARKAVVHGHCHHKAIMKLDDEETILRGMGLDYQILDSGCCGMAGAFGFEAEHYDVSVAVGERRLLPAVREAPQEALLVADGFSCKTQIEQLTDRRALHTSQVLAMARSQGPYGPPGPLPESGYPDLEPAAPPRRALAVAGAIALAGFAGAALRLNRRL
jgi:Fe-S oxidoreductase